MRAAALILAAGMLGGCASGGDPNLGLSDETGSTSGTGYRSSAPANPTTGTSDPAEGGTADGGAASAVTPGNDDQRPQLVSSGEKARPLGAVTLTGGGGVLVFAKAVASSANGAFLIEAASSSDGTVKDFTLTIPSEQAGIYGCTATLDDAAGTSYTSATCSVIVTSSTAAGIAGTIGVLGLSSSDAGSGDGGEGTLNYSGSFDVQLAP